MKTLIPITAMMAFCQIFLLSMFIPSANATTDPFIDEIIRPFMEKVDENGEEKDKPEWDSAVQWLLVEVENDPEYANGWFYLAKSVVLMLQDPRRGEIKKLLLIDPPGLLKTSLRNYSRLDPYLRNFSDRVLRARSEDVSRLDKVVQKVVNREYNPEFRNGFANVDEITAVLHETAELIRKLETFQFQEDPDPLTTPQDAPGISDKAKFAADSTIVIATVMWLKKGGVSSFRLRQLCDKLHEKYPSDTHQTSFRLYDVVMQLTKLGMFHLDDKQEAFKINEENLELAAPSISKIMGVPW